MKSAGVYTIPQFNFVLCERGELPSSRAKENNFFLYCRRNFIFMIRDVLRQRWIWGMGKTVQKIQQRYGTAVSTFRVRIKNSLSVSRTRALRAP